MTKKTFENHCKFDRGKIANNVLLPMLESIDGPQTITINAPWGYGKSTFLNHTTNLLEDNEYKVINFNAWENDFFDDPFIAIVSEIMTDSTADEDIKKSISNIIKSFIFTTIRVTSLINPLVTDAVNKLVDGAEDMLSETGSVVNEYNKLKNDIKTFKKHLNDISKDENIIFIIDELDRCRPSYAISLLERIKHFFDVPNITFLFGIDREQLSQSITTIYGSGMDTNGYLKRFFDVEIELPAPKTDIYLELLLKNCNLDTKIHSKFRQIMIAPLLTGLNFSARDIEKYVNRIKYIKLDNANLVPILFLTALKIKKEKIYNDIYNQNITSYQLFDDLKKCFSYDFIGSVHYHILYLYLSYYLGYKETFSKKNFNDQFKEDIKPDLIDSFNSSAPLYRMDLSKFEDYNQEDKNNYFQDIMEYINCLFFTRTESW